jgi:hypothetical protein
MELKMYKQINYKASEEGRRTSSWHLVQTADGKLQCSCGRELVKMDEHTYRCSAGFPSYRIDQGDILKGKNGELFLRPKPHERGGEA